ncbi:MAG TPA: hypothetical protein VF346_00975 [Bacteroidales bacterium]
MNNLSVSKCFLFILFFSLSIRPCNAQIFHRNPEKQLFGKSQGGRKEVKVKEPRKVLKAKRKQEANDQRLKKNYEKSIKKSQKRTFDIQTPEVQARMKHNKKNTLVREKEKKKKIKASSQKAGKKYE